MSFGAKLIARVSGITFIGYADSQNIGKPNNFSVLERVSQMAQTG